MARIDKGLVILVGRDRENPRTHREAFEITDGLGEMLDKHIKRNNLNKSEFIREAVAAKLEAEMLKEPLIKDEKIRKAVRAWADNLQAFMCDGEITFYDDKAYRTFQTDVWKGCNIRDIAELDLVFDEDSLEDGKIYTIEELCGEDKEDEKYRRKIVK